MKRKRFFITQTFLTLKHTPKWVYALSGGIAVGVLALYAAVFIVAKPLSFSYDTESCIPQLLLFPELQKAPSLDGFSIHTDGEVRVGSLGLFSTELCITPTTSPVAGQQVFAVSLFGWGLYAKNIALQVPEAPVVTMALQRGTKIPVNHPLTFPISSTDTVHSYVVREGDAKAPCDVEEQEVVCAVPVLKLRHGYEYTLAIERSFKGEDSAMPLGSVDVVTVDPVGITDSAVQNGQILYAAPESFTFTTNKQVKEAQAILTVAGETIPTTLRYDDASFTVQLSQHLPREAEVQLTISTIEAVDGGILPEPVTYTFTTSGGPKVQSLSVGASKVGQNERIIMTFDQPIVDGIDITRYVAVYGVQGFVERIAPHQVAITLSSAPLCAPFTLTVREALQSASNGWFSDEGWTHTSRVTCGYSQVIGHSVRGRPITAHYFGSGNTTILFTGGIHGSEPSSTTTMEAWAEYLYGAAYELPAHTSVVVVPAVNPDGIAAGTRNNAHNVNLARNFPSANWKADTEIASGVLPGGGGVSPGSEPEAAALITLTRTLRPRLEVSFHAQGSLVGANKYADSVRIGEGYAKMVGYKTMFYNAEAVMGYSITGEYEEWMGEEMNIPALLIELPTLSGNYFSAQRSALLTTVAQ